MPYFHNCSFGIYAKNRSQMFLTKRNQFTSIPYTALHLETNSFLTTVGANGATYGDTIYTNQAMYGIYSSFAHVLIDHVDLNRCQVGLYSKDRSFFKCDDSRFIGSGVTAAAGVVMDMNAVGSVYGISITGYITATGSTQGATFKVVNDSILYVDSMTAAALANTGPYGTVRYDPYRGVNAGGFGGVGSGIDLPPGGLEP